MGRSKGAPKRRRIEDETAEQEAIQALLSVPPDKLEGTFSLLEKGECTHHALLHLVEILSLSWPYPTLLCAAAAAEATRTDLENWPRITAAAAVKVEIGRAHV